MLLGCLFRCVLLALSIPAGVYVVSMNIVYFFLTFMYAGILIIYPYAIAKYPKVLAAAWVLIFIVNPSESILT